MLLGPTKHYKVRPILATSSDPSSSKRSAGADRGSPLQDTLEDSEGRDCVTETELESPTAGGGTGRDLPACAFSKLFAH